MEEKEIGLYIHMPFCKQKCYYCDFVSYPNRYEMVERYIKCLKSEIVQYANENRIMHEHGLEPKFIIKTIYIGGGTPSSIDELYILNVMETIKANFEIDEEAEITIEVNPGTASKEKLKTYREAGINRISIGLQAVQDRLLKSIGRIHNYSDFENTFEWAREAGFDNINVDLMFDLPDQTFEEWKESLENVCALEPQHISAYSLIIEEGTPFYDMDLNLPNEIQDREMYHFAQDFLKEKGFHQYEISNFAKEGKESVHNNVYWIRGDYKGFGLGASSLVNNHRLKNTENMNDYIAGTYVVEDEELTKEDIYSEFMFLGLRRNEGININDFRKLYDENIYDIYGKAINTHILDGLLEKCGDNIRLTRKGLDLANTVFVDFV